VCRTVQSRFHRFTLGTSKRSIRADNKYDLNSGDFTNHLKDTREEYNLPIWVTEYAVQNFSYVPAGFATGAIQASYTDIQIFMDVTRSFMESVAWIERYFWFGAMYEMVRFLQP